MSRERASSNASSHSSQLPLSIKLYRLSRPTLLTSHTASHPEYPPLPQSQLILPKTAQSVYVGEEFQCIVAVQATDPEVFHDSVHIRAEAEAPDGSRTEILTTPASLDTETPFVANKLSFELSYPGTWILRTSLLYDSGPEEKILRRSFKVDALPAISVRTKVSKGSSALKAHVLEAQVENLTDNTLVIESCVMNTKNGWESEAPDAIATEEESTGGGIVLRPKDVNQWSFILRGGWAPEAGPLAIAWRREPLGSKGWQTTGSIRI